MPEAPTLMSANVSNVKVDGKVVPGLQAIEYKVVRNKQNVNNIGTDERVGVDYGPMVVTGTLTVRSTYPKLDELLIKDVADVKGFQIVVELKKLGKSVKTLTFDECYLDGKSFSLDANGVGLSNYDFTSTRLREQ